MNELLESTLQKIEAENGDYNESFELVDELLKKYGEQNLAERLYADIDSTISWEIIANLFDILIWSTSDNGGNLTGETENWLIEATDIKKVKIAISLGIYPFKDQEKMEMVLNSIINQFPEISDQCNSVINNRRVINA